MAWVRPQGIRPVDAAITERAGYGISPRRRKRIERIFELVENGWGVPANALPGTGPDPDGGGVGGGGVQPGPDGAIGDDVWVGPGVPPRRKASPRRRTAATE